MLNGVSLSQIRANLSIWIQYSAFDLWSEGISIDGIFRVYVVIVARRKLSVSIIYVVTNWWPIGPGWGFGFHKPQTEVLYVLWRKGTKACACQNNKAHTWPCYPVSSRKIHYQHFLRSPSWNLSIRMDSNYREIISIPWKGWRNVVGSPWSAEWWAKFLPRFYFPSWKWQLISKNFIRIILGLTAWKPLAPTHYSHAWNT